MTESITQQVPLPPDDIRDVPLDDFDLFVHQSRETFSETEIRQLADNITVNGQLQAGVAWLDAGRNRFILICGERRYRALKMAGKRSMTVKVIHGTLTQSQMLHINLSENIQRASLNPIERARAFRRLMQLEGISAKEVALLMNTSDATVSRDLSLLTLPESLQCLVISGVLPPSVASHIARVTDEDVRRELAESYVGGQRTRDTVASEVKRLLKGKSSKRGKPAYRMACKLADGVVISVSASKLSWDSFLASIDDLKKAAQKLKAAGQDIAEVRSLKAS